MRPHGERWRAPYASSPERSRGRLLAEPPSPTRGVFQRDRDRILHSTAFRRLMHKTQVFIWHEGDHFRTRLTHTIEVGQIARALARSLGLDEDLAEALALSHDLGHTPFGHTGEDALDSCLAAHGGFDHNAQALRVVTTLERRYAAFDGLNLTWETLEGLVKHNGPLLDPVGRPTERYRLRGVPPSILRYDRVQPLELASHASAEAQAAALADDIAYNGHDLDDGLRAGILAFDALREVPFLRDLLDDIERLHPGLEPSRRIHELTRRVITRFVEDAVSESARRLHALAPADAAAIRAAAYPMVAFSPALAEVERGLKAFLLANLYHHPRLLAVRREAEAIIRNLYTAFERDPSLMPAEWRDQVAAAEPDRGARQIGDYIAGMTDRFAMLEHRRVIGPTPALRLA